MLKINASCCSAFQLHCAGSHCPVMITYSVDSTQNNMFGFASFSLSPHLNHLNLNVTVLMGCSLVFGENDICMELGEMDSEEISDCGLANPACTSGLPKAVQYRNDPPHLCVYARACMSSSNIFIAVLVCVLQWVQ